jgi:hypothetical protein
MVNVVIEFEANVDSGAANSTGVVILGVAIAGVCLLLVGVLAFAVKRRARFHQATIAMIEDPAIKPSIPPHGAWSTDAYAVSDSSARTMNPFTLSATPDSSPWNNELYDIEPSNDSDERRLQFRAPFRDEAIYSVAL